MKAGHVLADARTALVSAFVGLASRPDSCTLPSSRWGATPPKPPENHSDRSLHLPRQTVRQDGPEAKHLAHVPYISCL